MTSKRKSSTMSVVVKQTDMVFEDDDDEIEDQQTDEHSSVAGDSAKGSVSRVSGRAKKAKAIYDPSEYNGPVHKRKKDQMEAAERATKPAQPKVAKPVEMPSKPTVKTPVKVSDSPKPTVLDIKIKTPIKLAVFKSKPLNEEKKEVKRSAPTIVVKNREKAEAPPAPVVPHVPAAKEPSKRIQARKQLKGANGGSSSKKNRINSTSTGGGRFSSDDYDKASTVDLKIAQLPDVRKWSHEQVFQYFNNTLGFSVADSRVFKDEEIDGEALMIMKRSDIVTTKFQSLKLGVALKMWSQIIMFQTGSTDPTQAWK